MVLDDSAQIRRTLQGFESVLKEMASVCEVSRLQEELRDADQCVADMQSSLVEPLRTLEHAAAVSLLIFPLQINVSFSSLPSTVQGVPCVQGHSLMIYIFYRFYSQF